MNAVQSLGFIFKHVGKMEQFSFLKINVINHNPGIHAREWVGPATVLYLANQLTEQLSFENQDLIENLSWFIVPVVNVDGYKYSWDEDRLWKKTRSDYGSPFGCIGTDLVRNWDWHFGGNGTSDDLCSEIFHGPEAFSESESRSVRDFISRHNVHGQIRGFLDVHSFSQEILMSPGWDQAANPPFTEERLQAAEKV